MVDSTENDDEVTNWKFYRVAYSWENKAWGIYEQTRDNRLELIEGFWEDEIEASERMDELNREQGMDL